jgi:hypothetical protein
MSRIGKLVGLAPVIAAAPALAAASLLAGSWQKVPPAPTAVFGSGAWTGKQLLVVGRKPFKSIAVAESYDLVTKSWRQLASPPKLGEDFMCCKVLWTGKRLLAWGAFSGAAFDPATNSWQTLRHTLPGGIIVWTGGDAIGWGGGCCGDARSNGVAYNPATNAFRPLPRSPLAADQHPLGAWTGRELLLFVSGINPGARAAAYNPATKRWRRIAPLPARGGSAVWDGHELLVVAAGSNARSAFAYSPTTNRWRRLAPLPSGSLGATAVWTGQRLLLWSGQTTRAGLAYDPRSNAWSTLPSAPFKARGGSVVAWTGSALIVWGGEIGTPVGTSIPPKFPLDGAAFTPATR